MNILELLAIPASAFPDFEHVRCGDVSYTYRRSLEIVDETAALLKRLGATRGGAVACMSLNSESYALLPFAAASLGATFIPLNYRVRRFELAHMLRMARPQLLLVGSRYEALARDALADIGSEIRVVGINGGRIDTASPGAAPDSATLALDTQEPPAEPSVLMFTSGTTALPKAVELTHEQLSGYVLSTATLPEEPRGATLLAVPLYHIAGLGALLASTFGGRRLVVLPQFEPGDWLAAVAREQITHAFLVPTMLKRVIEHPSFASTDLSSLEVLSYGSAPMPLAVIRRALTAFPRNVGFVNAFGQTETTSTITMLLPDDHRLDGEADEIERKTRRLSSVGKALPDVEIAILGLGGAILPAGEAGDIGVRSARLMRQYRTNDGTAEAEQVGGWLITRDIGYLDQDGYLFLTGRRGDMIIRGGENIAPEEVRSVLAEHPSVEDVAVIGIPDEEWGQVVAAVVVPRSGSQVTPGELIDHCRTRLASYKKPEIIRLVDELPRNAMGKVVMRDLAEIVVRASDNRPKPQPQPAPKAGEAQPGRIGEAGPAPFVGPRLDRIAPGYAKPT